MDKSEELFNKLHPIIDKIKMCNGINQNGHSNLGADDLAYFTDHVMACFVELNAWYEETILAISKTRDRYFYDDVNNWLTTVQDCTPSFNGENLFKPEEEVDYVYYEALLKEFPFNQSILIYRQEIQDRYFWHTKSNFLYVVTECNNANAFLQLTVTDNVREVEKSYFFDILVKQYGNYSTRTL